MTRPNDTVCLGTLVDIQRMITQTDDAVLRAALRVTLEHLHTKPLSIASAGDIKDAIEIMLADGSPRHRKDIFNHLLSFGVQFKGEEPLQNMTAYLSSDSRFKNVGKGKWAANEPA